MERKEQNKPPKLENAKAYVRLTRKTKNVKSRDSGMAHLDMHSQHLGIRIIGHSAEFIIHKSNITYHTKKRRIQ